MSKFEEIQQQISFIESLKKTEVISLADSLNRTLQEDVIADDNMPPFDKSAMDGYACRMVDIEKSLEVLEVIPAGKMAEFEITEGKCSKIMTGAFIPKGADTVFRVEDAEDLGENLVKCINPKTSKNICYQGEDYTKGQVLINAGSIINTSHIAVLAGAGYNKVKVSSLPRVAIITTGSELVEPSEKPIDGQIRNSNSSQLTAQLTKMGLQSTYLGLFQDDYDRITEVFEKALADFDIIIFTGGASFGDFDWIPNILENHKFDIFWKSTGIKPGNPMTFAKKYDKYVIGLSGNPVSSLVQFEYIAKPIIYKLMGAAYNPFRIKGKLQNDYKRKKADRLAIIPVAVNMDGEINLIPFNGSANINALVFANALMEVELGINEYKIGDLVYVRPF